MILIILNAAHAFSEHYFIFPPMEQMSRGLSLIQFSPDMHFIISCLFVPWFAFIFNLFNFVSLLIFIANSWHLTIIHCCQHTLFYA